MGDYADAQALIRAGDVKRARVVLSRAIQANPRDESAWLLLASIAGKREHAVYCLEQALKLNPANFNALERLRKLRGSQSETRSRRRTGGTLKEYEVYRAKLHWGILVPAVIVVLFGMLLLLVSTLVANQDVYCLTMCSCPSILVGWMMLLSALWRYFSSELVLTNRRVTIRTGILSRSTFEVFLEKLESIVVQQPLLGRFLGYGTIVMTGTGGARQIFVGINNPRRVQRLIQAQIEGLPGR